VSSSICKRRSSLHKVDLVIPGPEQPLVDGVESHFRKGIIAIYIYLVLI
jgi:phosphoribosylamine-glycine ligase